MTSIPKAILSGLLLFNPISLTIIAIFAISLYTGLLLAVFVFGILKGCKEYLIHDLRIFLDEETIEKIKKFKIYEPKLESEEKPLFGLQFLLVPLLFTYFWARIITYAILSFTQWTVHFLISLGPVFQAFRHALFKFVVGQIKVLRYGVRLTVIPVVRAVIPFLELCIEFMINTGLEAYRYWKLHGPEIMMRIKTLSRTWVAVAFQYVTFWFRISYRYLAIAYMEFLVPVAEKTQQVLLHLYPKVKKFVLALFAVCEYLDDQLRPIFMPVVAFFLFQVKLVVSFYWNGLGVVYDSFVLFTSIPFRLVKVYVSVMFDLARTVLNRLHNTVVPLFHVLKPHILLLWNQFRISLSTVLHHLRILIEKVQLGQKIHTLQQSLRWTIQELLVYFDWTVGQVYFVYTHFTQQMMMLFQHFARQFS
jgi:hypothetical protein